MVIIIAKSKKIMYIPSQECWLLFKTYPTSQEQTKLPTILVQVCAQGDDKHSSVSVKWYVLPHSYAYIHIYVLTIAHIPS